MTTASLRPLRPHQHLAVDLLRQSIGTGHRCPMLCLPTGAGKTRIAAEIVHGGRAKRKRLAFSVPSLSLIDQTVDRFVTDGVDIADMGVIQADHEMRRPHAPIQICSAQTLARRGWPDVDIVVVDEAHVRFEVYDRWMTESGYGPKPMSAEERAATGRQHRPIFIGLSATPGAKGLGQWYDDLIMPTTMSDLIDAGFLSRFKVFAPSHPDLTGVRTLAGDYHEGMLGERMSKAQLVADVVDTWLRKGKGLRTLCFCVNRAHAQAVAEKFEGAGVRTAYVDANTPREERDEIGRRLNAREIEVVVNIGCLTTGVDWNVDCISLCRPTKSLMLFVQIIGRGLRQYDGKDHCLILDHSDTHLRLGMVTDIAFDELDDGKPKKKGDTGSDDEDRVPLPKECRECTGLVPAGAKECPCCGAVIKRPTNVQQQDGELTELIPGKPRPKQPRTPVLQQLRDMGKHSIIGQLYTLRDERGKSDGWVAANYRAIFDVWPRGLDHAPPVEPTYQLVSWIKARGIAYRKAMDAKRDRGEVVL